jgi:hypothetical protein
MIDQIIDHIRNRSYMSGVERDSARVNATGEVFTPTALVQEILDQLPKEVFCDPERTFLDNSCGDGQFLGEVLIRKLQNGIDFETALGTIYGVDIMIDNVDLCRARLLCGRKDLAYIVERNIVCQNALTYQYKFKAPGEPQRRREQVLRQKQQQAKKKLEQSKKRQEAFARVFQQEKNKKQAKKAQRS